MREEAKRGSAPGVLAPPSFQGTDSQAHFSGGHFCSFLRDRVYPWPKVHTLRSLRDICAAPPFLVAQSCLRPCLELGDLTPPSGSLAADLSGHELTHSRWEGERGDDKGDDSRVQQAAERKENEPWGAEVPRGPLCSLYTEHSLRQKATFKGETAPLAPSIEHQSFCILSQATEGHLRPSSKI